MISGEECSCLLISPDFFGYSKEIKSSLWRRGVKTMVFDDRPATDTLTKALIRISPRILKSRADAYFDKIIEEARMHPITEVLVIKGQALSCDAIRRFRLAFPNARFTLYFWDSYKNMSPDSAEKVALFDRAFTFDPNDANNDPRLVYRPLFYLNEYAELPQIDRDIDLFFFGTVHSDRYQVIRRLEQSLPKTVNIKKILYFSSKAVYLARRFLQPAFWRAAKSEFIFKPVARDEIMSLLARSRVVVDIERPVQAGLTMRTLETMGARKKLITTNPFAEKSDIYRPENILVIDRNNISIPNDFLVSDFVDLPADIRKKYTLDGWLDDVLFEVETQSISHFSLS